MLDKNHIKQISNLLRLNESDSEKFYKKSFISGEFSTESESHKWIEKRLILITLEISYFFRQKRLVLYSYKLHNERQTEMSCAKT